MSKCGLWVCADTLMFDHEKYCTSNPALRIGFCRDKRSDMTPIETRQFRIRASYSKDIDWPCQR